MGELLPHAIAVTNHSEKLEIALETTASLLNETGLYLRIRAMFAESKSLHERALKTGEIALGESDPKVAIFANNLGMVFQDMQEFLPAKDHFKSSLKMKLKFHKADHPSVILTRENLERVISLINNQPNK